MGAVTAPKSPSGVRGRRGPAAGEAGPWGVEDTPGPGVWFGLYPKRKPWGALGREQAGSVVPLRETLWQLM